MSFASYPSINPRQAPKRNQPTIHDLLRSLSNDFNLQLQNPDSTVSPNRRKEQIRTEEQERVNSIYSRAQYLHYKDPSQLSLRIGQFRSQADELLRQWVSKPRGDPVTTPNSADPHRVRSRNKERAALQTLLLRLLKGVDINESPRPRQRRSKRPSDEFSDPDAKRTKAQTPSDCVDDIPVRTKEVATAARPANAGTDAVRRHVDTLHNADQTQPYSFMSRSAATSRLSFAQSVFSVPTEGHYASSQTTVAFENSQKYSQDSYPACTAEYQALDESFSRYDVSSEYPEPELPEQDLPEPELPEPDPTQPFLSQVYDVKASEIQFLGSEGTAYSSVPEMADLEVPILVAPPISDQTSESLEDRLKNIWPKFPIPGLNHAPLIILWELTRAAIHCNVDLRHWDIAYKDAWLDQTKFRGQLANHPLFRGKGLPYACDSTAWKAAVDSFQSQDKAVALSAELTFSSQETGPLFDFKLNAPKLELGHRLGRRFGADRFLEILVPSPSTRDIPAMVKNDGRALQKIVAWLTGKPHYILGRNWSSFFVRSFKRVVKDTQSPQKSRNVFLERVYFVAVDGVSFCSPAYTGFVPPQEEATSPATRTKMRRYDLLNWALAVECNADQPVTKLFSRLALSLSKTFSTVVLEPHQIRHQRSDVRKDNNRKNEVMNDGVGRLSPSLARKIANYLGLSETPCAYQGRLGSAKGMWIVDVEDAGFDDQDWIETYPSQRKWECKFEDVQHRTFEVHSWPRDLKSASLNQQFIPVLEAQAYNPSLMRQTVSDHLIEGIRSELDSQASAMNHPIDLRAWMQKAGFTSGDRKHLGYVPFQAGLPEREEEVISYLLDAGFDAMTNDYLKDLAWTVQKRQSDQLKAKMDIQIPKSAYAYMVVDFTGTLEEGEVHFAFSNKFQTDGESETLLDGIDILVARAPAHFVSDIQKVKATFKPSLKRLKDVIVFSTKGKSPLADLLSGGDYDGDQAWVCWDPKIVQNFRSSPKPLTPDLIKQGYVKRYNPKFESILNSNSDPDSACTEFLHQAFSFSMQRSMLGSCTSYKEKLCYHENGVNSERAIALSTLVGLLVDQSKQGLLFTDDDFKRLRVDLKMEVRDREYEKERGSRYIREDGSIHVLDFLRFEVANVTIDEALGSFQNAIRKDEKWNWDKDLTRLYDEFDALSKPSRTFKRLMIHLRNEISLLEKKWKQTMSTRQEGGDFDFATKLNDVYQVWLAIKPPSDLMASKTASVLLDTWNGDPNLSKWALLKASTMFKMCYKTAYKMVWRLAGQQLAWMKAMASRRQFDVGAVPVTAEMWNVLRPDNKRIATLAARRDMAKGDESLAALEEVMEFDDNGTQIDDS